jgi:hypothetical protein
MWRSDDSFVLRIMISYVIESEVVSDLRSEGGK